MAAPSWAGDALGMALHLLGHSGKTLARLNTRANRDYRPTAGATTTTTAALTDAATSIAVTTRTPFPATPFFAELVYAEPPDWAANTVYSTGDLVIPTGAPTGYQYRCTTGGTSHATTEPVWPTSGTKTDGTVTWTTYSTGNEIVKVGGGGGTGAGSFTSLTRRARGLPDGSGGAGAATPPRVFKSGCTIRALGRYYTLTAAATFVGYTAQEAADLGKMLNLYYGMHKGYGERVFKMAQAKNYELTLTVKE